jgi:RNA polymerase sigma-70 factor (sigma-E family)
MYDVALVRAAEETVIGGPPVRWGMLVGADPVKYSGLGFPLFADYESRRGVEQLGGLLPPWAVGVRGGCVLDQSAAPEGTVGRAWPGVSGAAVFCNGLLTAVVVADDQAFGNRRLHAVPVRALLADGRFAGLIQEDVGVMPVLEAVEFKEFLQPPAGPALARTPGSLLAAAVEAVDFTRRDTELADLAAWRDDPVRFSVLLIAGEGGQGKTRLAREFADRTRRAGWVAGFAATESARSAGERSQIAHRFGYLLSASDRPVLVIADYAETHPDDIAAIVSDLLTWAPQSSVRLLLLSRAVGSWWAKLDETLPEENAHLIELSPLTGSPAERREAYAAAIAGLAHHFGQLPASPIGREPAEVWASLATRLVYDPPDLSDVRLGNALTLHMTALTDLLTLASGDVPLRLSKSEEQELLRHERDYLRRAAGRRGLLTPGVLSVRTDPDDCDSEAWTALERALAGLILFGPCNSSRADAIGRLAATERAADVLTWLAALYPSPKKETALGAVQPDRLAELLLGGILNRQPGLLGKIAVLTDGLDEAVAVLFTLLRTAAHPQFAVVGEQTRNLVISHPSPFARAAPILAATLAHAASMQGLESAVAALEVVSRRVDSVLGADDRQALAVAANVASAKLALVRDGGSSRSKRLEEFVLWQANDAVSSAEKAFHRYRELAQVDAGFLEDLLAASLKIMGISYGDLSDARPTVTEELLAQSVGPPTVTRQRADDAVISLYTTQYRSLRRLATMLVRDSATADEIVQDAFVSLHKSWDRLHNTENALSYLRQAVVNRSRSVLRHRTVVDKNLEKVPPDMPSAEYGALVQLERSAVVTALRDLPDRQREAIVLRYYADLSEAEIAAAMGISRGAVKSHTARGMAALRAALEKE